MYIFEVNNRLKLGKTSNLRTRIRNHNSTAYFYSGNEINKIAILGSFQDKNQAEMNLIYLVNKSNKFTKISDEWFLGNFDEMVSLAQQLTDKLT